LLFEGNNMTGPSRLGWLYAFLLLFALGASNTHAVYQYEYTGTTFDVTYAIGDVGSEVWPTHVSAEVFSPTLLTAGSDLTTPGLSFALSLNTALFGGGFASPLPYPAPPREPGTFIYDVTFNIGAVNAAGLPTAWNISIFYQNFNFPFGERSIATSNERDLVMHAVLRPFDQL
jgi:hypothetical protein